MVSLTAILLSMGATAELRFGSGGSISVFLIFLERNRKKKEGHRHRKVPPAAVSDGRRTERQLEKG